MELFRLLGTIAVENTDAVKALKETSAEGEKTESKLSSAVEKIGGAAAKVGKVVAAGVAATATAIGTITTIAVKNYADYEQLVGGVETLFKDSASKVIGYAENAYQTAGMSANEYMETVTGFSASLLQSLGGDTEKAADYANRAITDMADNANKMGTSMESIQNAYQGFAKQNYTMLDNLKLGYGGTKEEMARLIADAAKMKDVQEELGITVDASSMSYGNIVNAIHVMQTEMGIAGATQAEAASTISGSIGMLKASWTNFVTGLADENADLSTLMDSVIDSFVTVVDNIAPKFIEALPKLVGAVEYMVGGIAGYLPDIVKTLLPSLLSATMSLLQSITSFVIKGLPDIVSSIFQMMVPHIENGGNIIREALVSVLGDDFVSGMENIFSLIGRKTKENLVPDTIKLFSDAFATLKTTFLDVLNVIQPVFITFSTFAGWLAVDFVNVIDRVVIPIFSGLIQAFQDVTNAITTNLIVPIEKLCDTWESVYWTISDAYCDYIEPVIEQFMTMVGELWSENQDKIQKIGELFGVVFDKIAGIGNWFYESIILGIFVPAIEWISQVVSENMDNIKAYFQAAFDIIGGIIDFFIALFTLNWQGMWDAVLVILATAVELVKSWFTLIKEFISEIMNSIWTKVVEIWENIKISISTKISSIVSTVSGKFEEVKNSITSKINAAKDAVHDAIEKIKGFFDFQFRWPHIPMPHFSISPSGWKIGDLLDGVIPSIGVEWYAKGGVLEEPTAFGINGNKLMVGGEAGPEAVAPIDVLQKYIEESVAAQNTGLVDILQKILAAILSNNEEMKDKFIEALEEMRFDINNREFARLVKAVN